MSRHPFTDHVGKTVKVTLDGDKDSFRVRYGILTGIHRRGCSVRFWGEVKDRRGIAWWRIERITVQLPNMTTAELVTRLSLLPAGAKVVLAEEGLPNVADAYCDDDESFVYLSA